jgi:hypothetical protein
MVLKDWRTSVAAAADEEASARARLHRINTSADAEALSAFRNCRDATRLASDPADDTSARDRLRTMLADATLDATRLRPMTGSRDSVATEDDEAWKARAH